MFDSVEKKQFRNSRVLKKQLHVSSDYITVCLQSYHVPLD